jgi:hypothetical protein
VSDAAATFVADLSGLVVRFRGLDDALAGLFASRWAPFVTRRDTTPWLDVAVTASDHTIATGRPMRKSIAGEVRGGGGRFRSDEGEIEVDPEGRARVRLGRGDDQWRFWGLANLVGAALAVRLPSRPGALLHAAGVVIDGRGFVLIGPEGAGKSTFARMAAAGWERVISDDTVLVDGASGHLELLGSPTRSHEATNLGRGRWPIAALLHARWGTEARLDPAGRLATEALLAANLPFLSSGWGHDARLDALVPFLAGAVPHRVLTFSPDPSFVALLRAASF